MEGEGGGDRGREVRNLSGRETPLVSAWPHYNDKRRKLSSDVTLLLRSGFEGGDGAERLDPESKENTVRLPANTGDPERSQRGGKQPDAHQQERSAAETDQNKESAEETRHVPSFSHSGMNEQLYEKCAGSRGASITSPS